MIARRHVALLGAISATLAAMLISAPVATAAPAHSLIQGSGSSWASLPVRQWIADVERTGIHVVYSPSGSAQGRKDFAQRQVDFAVTDIPYEGVDPATHASDTSAGRQFSYVPIAAGGTAFVYNLMVGGHRVTNLRLSPETLAKIFTFTITNWDDPAISADNSGHALPPLPILPVLHSEGSATTLAVTRFMAAQDPALWSSFAHGADPSPYYPTLSASQQGWVVAGSDGVVSAVDSSHGLGTIGYDEYAYALAKNAPVAKVLNKAGYFTLPSQYNVAMALTGATFDNDPASNGFGTPDLTHVYASTDSRAYPLSGFAYLLMPTAADDNTMTTAKRQTLADYMFWSLCGGQREVGTIGYAPLPENLVQYGITALTALHQTDPQVDVENDSLAQCNNPTFDPQHPNVNTLAEIAPLPAACDHVGATPCGDPGANGSTSSPTPTVSTSATTSPSAASSVPTTATHVRTATPSHSVAAAATQPLTAAVQPRSTALTGVDIARGLLIALGLALGGLGTLTAARKRAPRHRW